MNAYPKPLVTGTPFYWGVATSGRQFEGNLDADDWEVFTTAPEILQRLECLKQQLELPINPQPAGVALNHWSLTEFISSVERAQALGSNAYRFSIEWSRVEPASGRYDSTALAHYQSMVDAVRSRGMEPILVLNHLSLPAWVSTPPRESAWTLWFPGGKDTDADYRASLRGWEATGTVDAYVRYVEHVVVQLQGVRFWITFNEPLAATVPIGYLAAVFPPGFLGDGEKAKSALHNLVAAHARAYEAIHAIAPASQVGITDQWLYCKTDLNWTETAQHVYYHQDFLINALVQGKEDTNISVSNPSYQRVLGIPEADWRPHLDFFGLQYYKSVYPQDHPAVALKAPFYGALFDLDLKSASYAHQLLNDLGWEVYPEGLYESLMKLKQIASFDGQALPILVSENGTAEVVDRNRSAYITAHLEQMQRAQQDGANIFGYLHWSIADNWEWIDGYRQEARFGLFSVDRSSPSSPHTITDGALALAYALENPSLTVPAAIARFGRYRPDGSAIEHPSLSPYATFKGTMDGQPVTLLLAAPPALPAPAPARYTSLIGLLFYGDNQRWVRLKSLVWEPATRTLKFSHPQFTAWPQTPERAFAGTLDPAGQKVGGLVSEIWGRYILQRGWQLSRLSLARMWQAHLDSGESITLSLSCPEGVWRGRVLRGTDWNNLENVNLNATGFTASENGGAVVATLDAGNNLTVSPWSVSLQRLPDGLPF